MPCGFEGLKQTAETDAFPVGNRGFLNANPLATSPSHLWAFRMHSTILLAGADSGISPDEIDADLDVKWPSCRRIIDAVNESEKGFTQEGLAEVCSTLRSALKLQSLVRQSLRHRESALRAPGCAI
jgi:hypothetical protein